MSITYWTNKQRETTKNIIELLKKEGFLIDERACGGLTANRNPDDIRIRIWVKKTLKE
jgi:hypothetical protein